jgi:hypothetical protein
VSTEGAADMDCCAVVVDEEVAAAAAVVAAAAAAAAVGVEVSQTIFVKTHSPLRGSFSSSKHREVNYVIRSMDIFVRRKDRESITVLRILIRYMCYVCVGV